MAHHPPHSTRGESEGGRENLTGVAPSVVRRDTIVAVATPPGRGGIGVVRLSGPAVGAIAVAILGKTPPPRKATLADFKDEDRTAIDTGIALYFERPRSFTGEDVLELQGHGGPAVLQRLLERACALGARLARPGEFTERAFRNDKLDLAQAEAVADLIDSASRQAARSAMRSLTGEFSRQVADIDRQVLRLRVYIEAAIDFADEDIDFLGEEDARRRVREVAAAVEALLVRSRQGQVLRDGLDVVIAGAPNAGKSSLLNRLLAENRAIVTDIPGTTRDLLSADIEINGVPMRLTDTAGLRASGDRVEMIGVDRARQAVANADVVLLVEDDTLPEPPPLGLELPAERTVRVRNKVDLTGRAASDPGADTGALFVSAKTGAGLDALRQRIVYMAGGVPPEGVFLARKRHLNALEGAAGHVAAAQRHVRDGCGDLAAEALRGAQDDLGSIVGKTNVDDLLGEIFKTFCVGK